MAQYQVKTILTDGTELNSGIIDVPGTSIIVNNEELPVADLSNATFIPRYESTSNTTITKTVDSYSGEHSIKWDPISVTGTNILGNGITAQDSIIELAMGDSDDIVLRSQQTPNASGQYLVWELSDTALQGYATEDYVNTQIDSKVSAVYKYKGSVATYNDLPSSGQTVGDVYNVEDTGDNYAWDGTTWDKLSGTVDLSAYATTADVNSKLSTKQDTLVSGTNIKTINGESVLGGGDLTISGGGDYLPLTGGGMTNGARISFNGNYGSGVNDGNAIEIITTDRKLNDSKSCIYVRTDNVRAHTGIGAGRISLDGDATYAATIYRQDGIDVAGGWMIEFPKKKGTFALLSDIPTITDNGDGTMTITANGTTYKVAIVTE